MIPGWAWAAFAIGGFVIVSSVLQLLVGIKNDLSAIRRILADDHVDRLERERRERGEW